MKCVCIHTALFLHFSLSLTGDALLSLPPELSRFESHLCQPVKMHNIRKRMQMDAAGKGKKGDIEAYARENHLFAEGKLWGLMSRTYSIFVVNN